MFSFRHLLLGLLTSLVLAGAGITLPVIPGAVTPAYAQVSAEFQEALEPYGHWVRHARWGEIWVPDDVPPGWRPYEYGHWVYTDEWGWYWISDPEEEDWGWVTFHYGRWANDRRFGWFWIPDDDWAPAWVDWRYGDDYVGWAPMPPDEIIYEHDDAPSYWVFVSPRFLTAPRLHAYIVPQSRRAFALRRTRVVNRTVGYGRGRAAVNAGLSPAFVARVTRAALPTYRVSPRVLAGTQGVSGAVRVTPDQLRARGPAQRGRKPNANRVNAVAVQPTATTIAPAASPAAPAPLAKGERGKLGTHPPRAAQGAPAPQQQQQPPQQPQQRQQQRAAPPTVAPPATQQHVPPQRQTPQAKPERPTAPQTPPPPPLRSQQPTRTPPPPVVNKPAPPPHVVPPATARPQPPATARPKPPAVKPAAPPPHPERAKQPPEKRQLGGKAGAKPEEKKKPDEVPK
jgi:hypothetical protein